jgi:hypothetical protein
VTQTLPLGVLDRAHGQGPARPRDLRVHEQDLHDGHEGARAGEDLAAQGGAAGASSKRSSSMLHVYRRPEVPCRGSYTSYGGSVDGAVTFRRAQCQGSSAASASASRAPGACGGGLQRVLHAIRFWQRRGGDVGRGQRASTSTTAQFPALGPRCWWVSLADATSGALSISSATPTSRAPWVRPRF